MSEEKCLCKRFISFLFFSFLNENMLDLYVDLKTCNIFVFGQFCPITMYITPVYTNVPVRKVSYIFLFLIERYTVKTSGVHENY